MSLFESFKVPAFRYAWSSISFNGLGNQLNSVALAWLALEFTGSPLGVGAILATRNVPRLLLAIPFGTLSDRADRRLLLALANYGGAVSSLIVAIASGQEWFGYVALMFTSATSGVIDVAQTNWSKAYVFDVVGHKRAVNGLAMEQLANKLFGMVGGFAGGLLLLHTGAGGIVALLLLGVAHRINPNKAVFLVAAGFAIGLIVFSTARSMLAAGTVILFVGAAWAVLDSLLPTALQLNVANEHRGASVGIWNLSRGFAPIGHLEIGALAAVIGVATAQVINGLLFLAVVAAAGWIYSRVSRPAGSRPTD